MQESEQGQATARPVIFGEVLFDHFPDGSRVLGGAPFNVAWHLQGFGLKPLLISRVGDDDEGSAVRSAMQQWGMDTSGLQQDHEHPTGAVQVSLHEGQPSFDIVPDQAYDFIQADTALSALSQQRASVLYCGTLAARQPVSRQALACLIEALQAPLFADINLRAPWWRTTQVHETLQRARWVKLNDDELASITGCAVADIELPAQAERLRREAGLAMLVVTLGAEGAWIISDNGSIQGRPPGNDAPVDTVGAGDAFSAVCIYGLLHGWSDGQILQHALSFAARICGQRGATAADPQLYRDAREAWR